MWVCEGEREPSQRHINLRIKRFLHFLFLHSISAFSFFFHLRSESRDAFECMCCLVLSPLRSIVVNNRPGLTHSTPEYRVTPFIRNGCTYVKTLWTIWRTDAIKFVEWIVADRLAKNETNTSRAMNHSFDWRPIDPTSIYFKINGILQINGNLIDASRCRNKDMIPITVLRLELNDKFIRFHILRHQSNENKVKRTESSACVNMCARQWFAVNWRFLNLVKKEMLSKWLLRYCYKYLSIIR